MLDDFSFRGEHIRAYGAHAAFGERMLFGADITRSEYALPGGGMLEIGEAAYQPVTRHVTFVSAGTVQEDAVWRRRLTAWLQGGRGQMIVDNDPHIMRLAQFDKMGTWDTAGWPEGEMEMTMTLQPLAYSVLPAQVSGTTQGGYLTLAAAAQSALPMPLAVSIAPKSGTATRIEVTAAGQTLILERMQLTPGHTLTYDAGQMMGDVSRLEIDGHVDFSPVAQWKRLLCPHSGVVEIRVTGAEAQATVTTRGRWPA